MNAKTIVQPEFQDDIAAIVTAHKAAEESAARDDDAMSRIAQWIASGNYPNNATIIAGYVSAGYAKGSAAVYASAILKWVRAGQVPRGIRHAVNGTPSAHKPSGRGRPKGKGKGKTTKPGAPDTTTPQVPEGSAWSAFMPTLTGLKARCAVLEFKDGTKLPSDELAQVQDALDRIIVTVMRRIK